MHSRGYLDEGGFTFTRGSDRANWTKVFSDWTPADRIVAIAPAPVTDSWRFAGIVLAWTARFYRRVETESPDFFDYRITPSSAAKPRPAPGR